MKFWVGRNDRSDTIWQNRSSTLEKKLHWKKHISNFFHHLSNRLIDAVDRFNVIPCVCWMIRAPTHSPESTVNMCVGKTTEEKNVDAQVHEMKGNKSGMKQWLKKMKEKLSPGRTTWAGLFFFSLVVVDCGTHEWFRATAELNASKLPVYIWIESGMENHRYRYIYSVPLHCPNAR